MSIQATIDKIRRNDFEERDGHSLGCVGPICVMLKNSEAMALADYAEQLRDAAQNVYGWLRGPESVLPSSGNGLERALDILAATLAKNPAK